MENYKNIGHSEEEKVLEAANQDIDATLKELSEALKADETLVLDVSGTDHDQTDMIYDTLIMKGYGVRKSFRNGRHQILINRKR